MPRLRPATALPRRLSAQQTARVTAAAPYVVDAILDAIDAIDQMDDDEDPGIGEQLKRIAVIAATWIVVKGDG